jgi:hypothetical protein
MTTKKNPHNSTLLDVARCSSDGGSERGVREGEQWRGGVALGGAGPAQNKPDTERARARQERAGAGRIGVGQGRAGAQ